jgi:phosphoribosylglycinamide formyltransferase-1
MTPATACVSSESASPSPAVPSPLRVAVLASGRGSNLEALIDARAREDLPIELVVAGSNRARCRALSVANGAGIATFALDAARFHERAAFDRAMFDALETAAPDLVVLAGYMRIIDDTVVATAPWPMINIHPSLLPLYPGLDTHARVLAAGDAQHGASVHAVIPALDAGPVIAQVRIPLRAGDTPDAIAQRLLPREHALLVATVRLFAERRIAVTPAGIQFDGSRLATPLLLDPNDDRLHQTRAAADR